MRLYKVIKYCRICSKKFFAGQEKGFSQYYCEECVIKYKKNEVKKEEESIEK